MEHNPTDSRRQLLRPGVAILFAVFGLVGAVFVRPWYVSHALAWFAAAAAVVFLAKSVDRVLSGARPANNGSCLASAGQPRFQARFGPRTLLVVVMVVAVLFVLGVWNEAPPDLIGEYPQVVDISVYGFPFRCLRVETFWSGRELSVDFLLLAADLAVGAALVVGIELEAEHRKRRHGPKA
jgi:hypothetical protein